MPLAHPPRRGHAYRRPGFRQPRHDGGIAERAGTGTGAQCGDLARHCRTFLGHPTGHSLGLWLSHRRGGGLRCRGGVRVTRGVGYDINCGVRLLRSDLEVQQVRPHLQHLADTLFRNVPSGVGSHRRDLKLSVAEERKVLQQGARWVVSRGMGSEQDLEHIEAGGRIEGADPELLSDRALERGRDQLGTSARETTFWKCRWWRRSGIRSWRRCWDCSRGR